MLDNINNIDDHQTIKRLAEMEKTLEILVDKVGKLYDKLVGNELNPTGFIKEFDELKKEVKDLKEFRNKIVWSISLAGIGGGICGYLLQIVLNYIKK